MNRRQVLEVAALEDRRLLSGADLTTAATVTTVTHGVVVVQPMKATYATNTDSVRVNFTASDDDDTGPAPTTHFEVTNLASGAVVINNGTGSSLTLTKQDEYLVQFWSTDSDDSEAVDAHSILIAIDRTGPMIRIDTVTPNILWPPNGKYVTVTVTGTASDSLSGVNDTTLAYHVADEYGLVQPSGAITDITATGATAFGGYTDVHFSFQIRLQASRHGYDRDGRHYMIGVTADDTAGNIGTATAEAIVPHDMGHNVGGTKSHPGSSGTGVKSHRHGNGNANGQNGNHGSHGNGQSGGSGSADGGDQGNGHGHGNGNSHGHGKGHG
jgi:hypothetical protein